MPKSEKTLPEPPNLYPGPLGIWKNANLTPEEQTVEQRFTEQLQHDLDATFRAYLSRHGRILDADLARELSEDYRTLDSRLQYTNAVHNPSSALSHVGANTA